LEIEPRRIEPWIGSATALNHATNLPLRYFKLDVALKITLLDQAAINPY